jgi:hypothetical protein
VHCVQKAGLHRGRRNPADSVQAVPFVQPVCRLFSPIVNRRADGDRRQSATA